MWGAVKAGIKASGKLDLAAAVAAKGATGAAMFTKNQVVAAPVTVGRRHLAATGGRVGAVLVNAGNANCATGQPGIDACVQTCAAAAESFGCIFDEVFPSSTGIIGVPFPGGEGDCGDACVEGGVGRYGGACGAVCAGHHDDGYEDEGGAGCGGCGRVGGADMGRGEGCGDDSSAVGSAPTCDDAGLSVYRYCGGERAAAGVLEPAVERSFNSISIDGDTSTNDTVLLLASGASGVKLNERSSEAFANALEVVCGSLAYPDCR